MDTHDKRFGFNWLRSFKQFPLRLTSENHFIFQAIPSSTSVYRYNFCHLSLMKARNKIYLEKNNNHVLVRSNQSG